MRLQMMTGVFVGGSIGGWIGALIDHGNWFGLLSLSLSTIGSFVAIWVVYKANQYIG